MAAKRYKIQQAPYRRWGDKTTQTYLYTSTHRLPDQNYLLGLRIGNEEKRGGPDV
jgi:hypothetical protein